MITCIVEKNSNNTTLNYFEISIRNMYTKYITEELFKKGNPHVLISKDGLYDYIRKTLVDNNTSVIKLTFSNDCHIYVNKSILLRMDFFKNMFENYGQCHKLIFEIVVDKCYDNYNFFMVIVDFLEGCDVDVGDDFNELVEELRMLNYLDVENHNGESLIDKVANNLSYCNIVEDTIDINIIEETYDLCNNNGVEYLSDVVDTLWLFLNKNDNKNAIFQSIFFKKGVMETNNGINYVFENRYMPHYAEYWEKFGYQKKCDIISELVNSGNFEAYETLINIRNENDIDGLVLSCIDNFTNLILKFDLSKFTNRIILILEMKFGMIDEVNTKIHNKFNDRLGHEVIDRMVNFVTKHNENDNDFKKKLADYNNVNAYNHNRYNHRNITKSKILVSLIPFNFYVIMPVIEVDTFDPDENHIVIGRVINDINIFIDYDTDMFYKNDNDEACKLKIKKISQQYKVGNQIKMMDCNGIISNDISGYHKQLYTFTFEMPIEPIKSLSNLYIKV